MKKIFKIGLVVKLMFFSIHASAIEWRCDYVLSAGPGYRLRHASSRSGATLKAIPINEKTQDFFANTPAETEICIKAAQIEEGALIYDVQLDE